MEIRIGTSGYSYKEWKGRFYPDDLPEAQMLRFYAERFATVEINNTFYRMPSASLLSRWAEQTGEGFTFVLKAPQRITHQKRLGDVAGDLTYFYETASVLGAKLGPVLFQLPPYLKKDMDRLRAFLDRLPPSPPAAFEFRHASWAAADVHDALRAKNCALCLADTDEEPVTELLPTADWGYLRLRRSSYADPDLEAWTARIRAQAWSRAFVFLKHEDEAKGPEFASALRARFNATSPP